MTSDPLHLNDRRFEEPKMSITERLAQTAMDAVDKKGLHDTPTCGLCNDCARAVVVAVFAELVRTAKKK